MATDQRGSATVPPTYVNANRLWVDSRLRYEIGLRGEGRILHRPGARGGRRGGVAARARYGVGLGGGGRILPRLGARGAVAVEMGTGRRGLGARVAVEV